MTSGTSQSHPVLERDREIERIRGALDDALAGAGGFLLVEGPAGIGKTTLAIAARDQSRSLGMRVLRATGNQLERDLAYGVCRQLFDPVLRAATPGSRARLLEGAEAAQAALQLTATAETASGSEYATLYGLYWLLANLSDEQPLLVLVDDVHWADQASARWLAFLAPRLIELPVLLIMCARPDEWAPETLFAATASDVAAQPLVPAPLSEHACASLVHARFEAPVDDAFIAACHTATGGNPFLIRALVDELVADRTPPRAASVDGVLAMGPRVVTRAIVARLGRLAPEARVLAAALVVLGDGARAEDLAALTGLTREQLRDAAGELARVAIVDPDVLRFAHPIVRNAIWGDLAPAERDRLHRKAAALLERQGADPERIAAHLVASEPAGSAHSVAMLRRAADAALAAGATQSAVAYLRRALAEPCPEGERVDLLVALGRTEQLIDGRASIAHLKEALELAEDPARYVEIATLLAWALSYGAYREEAVATAVSALARLGDSDRDIRRRLESTIMRAGEHDPSMAAEQARIEAQLADVESEEGLGARTLQGMLAYDRMETLKGSAAELVQRAEQLLSDELPLRMDNGGSAFIAPIQILMAADSELALHWLDRGLELARLQGDGFAVAANLFFSCYAHLLRGELSDAILDGTGGLEEIDRWGIEAGRVWCASVLADALVEAGELEQAQRTLTLVGPAHGETPQTAGWDAFLWARGALALARSDPRSALRDTLAAAGMDGEPINPALLPWRSRAAVAIAVIGEEPERAQELAREEVEHARRWGAPGALGVALRAQGLVLGDQAGERSLREAIDVLDSSPAKLEHARALIDLGALLRRSGRRSDARAPLSAGLKLARACGATPLAQKADDELRATGASARNVIRAGADALTSSERRVVKLAASGMSNKQIAQTLFVTVKTVETHLHRSYQKLDVSSRAELATVAETLD